MEELFCPSVLIYDSQFDITALRENKPYRNIGQLLMSAKCVRDALRLCGAEERVLDGTASDYECFVAICSSMEYLAGHVAYNSVKRLLAEVFGVYERLSPYSCDELWTTLNCFIDDNGITPASLLNSLNVESLTVRISPFNAFDIASDNIDYYALTDLSDIVSLVTSDGNREGNLESFISRIASVVKERAESGSFGVSLRLGADYEFERMSRRHEIYEIYTSLKSGKCTSISAQNGLITYVLTSLFGTFCTVNSNIITETSCKTSELGRLLDYLKLNEKLPTSMLIKAVDPKEYLPLALKYSSRNKYGLPSIITVTQNVSAQAEIFPIGLAIECQSGITDAVALASLISSRDRLYYDLSQITDADADSLLFDMTYANIKNRMRI